ncbi:MAG: PSD1 domain-containing protein [Planctomycetales bacterium]|nr:PSD1 domain-containing protein [Planctomycetales bacterium]
MKMAPSAKPPLATPRRGAPAGTALALIGLALAQLAGVAPAHADDAKPVDFQRDIQPLLAAKCYACHGPDESHREADLRLDDRQAAISHGAIVPGKPAESELLARVKSTDAEQRMPPADHDKPLSPQQIELLTAWIAADAPFETHWAFVPPRRPTLPNAKDQRWAQSPVDRFVLSRIEAAGQTPSPPASAHDLARRVYLDLIGLPPTPEQLEAFLADLDSGRPGAYERLVDRLLSSPQYGERWARPWLDLARYADTNGYEKDRERSIWPYRDWVIQALNADLPYDRFSIEQLAGDMLPGATDAQRIATGFHRNTMLNEEGGIDPLEYRFYAMTDRVATTGLVWLGLTTGCAQCHSHKYDPLTQQDYYSIMALLNNADEPDLLVQDAAVLAKRRQLEQQARELEDHLAEQFPLPAADSSATGTESERRQAHLDQSFAQWLNMQRAETVPWRVIRPTGWQTNLPRLEVLDDGSLFSTGDITKRDEFVLTFDLGALADEQRITALRLEVLPDDRLPAQGPGRAFYEGRKGDFFLSELEASVQLAKRERGTGGADGAGDDDANPRKLEFADASVSYGKLSIGGGSAEASNLFDGDGSTGWSTSGQEGQANELVLPLQTPLSPTGTLSIRLLFERHFAASLGRFRFSIATSSDEQPSEPKPRAHAAVTDELRFLLTKSEPSEDELAQLKRHYLLVAPELAAARKPIDKLRDSLPSLPSTMVMQERPDDNPRPTHRHHRGEYLSPREPVTPALPMFLRSASDEQAPRNRLEFAKWLVSRDNPLAARVAVNRAWRHFWGAGLVRTAGDFGTQADPPTHPQLLDFLAVELVDSGWSLKRLHRLIVTSAAYRQQSAATSERHRDDPDNRLLARGPRARLDAELVRDTFLSVSGLLAMPLGGPSVYPPQPDSVTQLAYGNAKWPESRGESKYRRSLYTFSKRTAPFAAYAVFDGPTGENCLPRRNRSNTPLQALTLLNDPMFLEAAQSLARDLAATAAEPAEKLNRLFRRVLTRPPQAAEAEALLEYYRSQLARLNAGELKPAEIIAGSDSPEAAAWTLTARVLLNLDETISKP